MPNRVYYLDWSLLWSPGLGCSYPSAKALPSLLCTVSSTGLLRQSKTFWIHIICSCEDELRERIFHADVFGTLQVSIIVLHLTWKQANQVGQLSFVIHSGRKQEKGRFMSLLFHPFPTAFTPLPHCCGSDHSKIQIGTCHLLLWYPSISSFLTQSKGLTCKIFCDLTFI